MDANRTRYARKRMQRRGRPPGSGAKHLLAGVLRCAVCGAGMEARSRNHGKERVYFYGCSAFHRKGSRVCSNNLTVPMRAADAAVLEALKDQLLGASVIDEALRRAARQLIAPRTEEATLLQDRLSVLDAEMTNLTKALAEGGNMTALLDALKTRELERRNLSERLKALHAPTVIDLDEIREHLQRSVQDWRRTLIKHPNEARLMLQQLVEGRLEMQPREDGDERYYEFSGVGTVLPLVGGAVSHNLASPTGFEPVSEP
jgi:Recombinase zinc beta ribbon domain